MNTSTTPLGTGLPSRRSSFLRRTAFVVAALLTLVALFYAVENWRGRRAWEQCQRELKARGERLDWTAHVPARVPNDQNFIKTPLLEAVGYRERVTTNTWRALEEARQWLVWEAWVDSGAGRKMDWARCQDELRRRPDLHLPPLPQDPAADLLQALQPIQPLMDELRTASARPQAQFDIDRSTPFEASPDFNFVAVRTLAQLFAFHACAELALHHGDQAFMDVRVIERLADALKGESTLVALMVRVALQGLVLEPFWQGWAEGRWSEGDLERFEELFGRVDLLPEFTPVVRGERAGVNALVEKYGIEGNEFWRITMRSEPEPKGWWEAAGRDMQRLPWKLLPRGWVWQNLASYNRRIQAFIPSCLQTNAPTVSPVEVDELRERVPQEIRGGPYGWLSQMAIPNFARALETLARVQTFVNEARIVCGLERCRIRRGQYPESLAELAPQFVDRAPLDVLDGKPLKYRRNGSRFLLYSIGWNQMDDDGTAAPRADASARPDYRQGDWVWCYPVQYE